MMSSGGDPPMFDSFAEEYERHAADNAYNALYDRPAALELLGSVAGQHVLDAGCGPGLYAEELIARGAEVVSFDSSPAMVRLARQRLPDQMEVRVHNMDSPLDWLEDESFDAAVMALVIHHLDERTAALRELWRVLRPGSPLVVSTHHPTSDWLRLGGSYFENERVEEDWHEGRWRVRYWRMPLQRRVVEIRLHLQQSPIPSVERRPPLKRSTRSLARGWCGSRFVGSRHARGSRWRSRDDA
jgi:SAM-dependent methyltransferase